MTGKSEHYYVVLIITYPPIWYLDGQQGRVPWSFSRRPPLHYVRSLSGQDKAKTKGQIYEQLAGFASLQIASGVRKSVRS